jgi:hypothetical protein
LMHGAGQPRAQPRVPENAPLEQISA